VGTVLKGLCASTPRTQETRLPRQPPPGSPHLQRTVWKAQRGRFSKLSPNLRTRSRRSRCESPAGPFIITFWLRRRLHYHLPPQPEAAALAVRPQRPLPPRPSQTPPHACRSRLPGALGALIGCLAKRSLPLTSDPAPRLPSSVATYTARHRQPS
jgi:hypothetical protein